MSTGEGYRRREVAVPQFYILQTRRTAINNSLSVRGIYRSIVEVPALLTQIRSRPMIKLNASSNGVGDSQSITAPQGAISTHPSQAAIDRLDPLPSQREANLVALIENIQHAIWSVDPHYCIITLNSMFQRHFSAIYGVELQAGTNVVHSLPPEQQSLWASYYDRALQGEQFSVEIGYTLATRSTCIHVAFRPIISTDQRSLEWRCLPVTLPSINKQRRPCNKQKISSKPYLMRFLAVSPGLPRTYDI
ncbi:MAG: hypothetical protein HC881_15615 [Leptolyngbyaceae cyanobacterium SL_7_1]|nr:hypothetical protein [Leptolyngbyaceae cyanobacterium SL_7_1]